MVVVADREHHRPCMATAPHAALRSAVDDEHWCARLGVARDRLHLFAECYSELERIRDTPVVAERLVAGRFLVRRHERQPPDLEQVGRGEERHPGREVEDRVDERALLDDLVVELRFGGSNGDGETGRAGADNQQVADGHSFQF